MLDLETSKSNSVVTKSNSNNLVRDYFFLENYVTSERAVSHNVYTNDSLLVSKYVRSYAKN